MTKKIAILTKDRYLYQKIALELKGAGFEIADKNAADGIICDIDTENAPVGATTIGRGKNADLIFPTRLGAIASALSEKKSDALVLLGEKMVSLNERRIKLTDVEYSLLSLLVKKRAFVSRDEILRVVWNGDADGGVVNVYIHYLREKLESDGKRVIISSRREGYKIREDLLGENEK